MSLGSSISLSRSLAKCIVQNPPLQFIPEYAYLSNSQIWEPVFDEQPAIKVTSISPEQVSSQPDKNVNKGVSSGGRDRYLVSADRKRRRRRSRERVIFYFLYSHILFLNLFAFCRVREKSNLLLFLFPFMSYFFLPFGGRDEEKEEQKKTGFCKKGKIEKRL